jgi:hypothetical protein
MSDLSIAVFLLAENRLRREVPTRFPNKKTKINGITAVVSAKYSVAGPETGAAVCAMATQRQGFKHRPSID